MTPPSRDSTSAVQSHSGERTPNDEDSREGLESSLRRVDRLATLLDDQFRIPGTDVRVGLDPILGLLPGGGDWVAWVAGLYIIWEAARLDVPSVKLIRMGGYVGLDLLGGYVPVLGDLFDAVYRSNRKNAELLFDHFDFRTRGGGRRELPERLPESSSRSWRSYLLVSLLTVLLTGLALGPIALLWWLLGG